MKGNDAMMHDVEAVGRFMLGGLAVFTLVSRKTGDHVTWKLLKPSKPNGPAIAFAHLRVAAVAHGDMFDADVRIWEYRGIVDRNHEFCRGSKPGAVDRTRSEDALRYALYAVFKQRVLPSSMEFWHEGHCGRCGLPLTHPQSIERGFGPGCWGQIDR